MTLDEGVDRSLLRIETYQLGSRWWAATCDYHATFRESGETEAEALRELAIAALRRWQQDRWEEE